MQKIKYLIMDVDGTLTDGKIYMGENGELCKAFSIKDGCGIRDVLIPAGIIPVIITGRFSNMVSNRCRELGITEVYQDISNKAAKLCEITEDFETVAYIGDDINDLTCMNLIRDSGGVTGCPRDAVKKVCISADFIAAHDGGDGAVRDFIEWLVENGKIG